MKIFFEILTLLVIAAAIRFILFPIFSETHNLPLQILLGIIIIVAGVIFVLSKAANIIEETTEILSERTQLAGGLLQSLGTAFPDMILGIIAALLSVSYRTTDWTRAVNYAIIASATTFGSNIYNISYAAWAIFRQNTADALGKAIPMFQWFPKAGSVKPLATHTTKPTIGEIDIASSLLTVLTVLTAFVAVCMVIFGRVTSTLNPTATDLYQLIIPIGWIVLILAIVTLYTFRKNMRDPNRHDEVVEKEEKKYLAFPTWLILIVLLVAGISILFVAESMVRAIEEICTVTNIPFVVAGVLAGIIGCLGEILVIHNFSVNPKGRIGDALVGVAMDNIVTILGASIVAIMGGIFLGGNALILIFVIILTLNTLLLWQIGKLQRTLLLS